MQQLWRCVAHACLLWPWLFGDGTACPAAGSGFTARSHVARLAPAEHAVCIVRRYGLREALAISSAEGLESLWARHKRVHQVCIVSSSCKCARNSNNDLWQPPGCCSCCTCSFCVLASTDLWWHVCPGTVGRPPRHRTGAVRGGSSVQASHSEHHQGATETADCDPDRTILMQGTWNILDSERRYSSARLPDLASPYTAPRPPLSRGGFL